MKQTIQKWIKDDVELKHSLKGHTQTVKTMVFSPDGKQLVTGSNDNTVKIWNIETGECVKSFYGAGDWFASFFAHERDYIKAVAISPDGKYIVAGSDDYTAKIWDVASGKWLITLKGHKFAVIFVAFSGDGKSIVTGSEDKFIKIWNIDSESNVFGKCIATCKYCIPHIFSPKIFAISSDTKIIAVKSGDNNTLEPKLKLLELSTKKCVFDFNKSYDVAAFSPDDTILATGGSCTMSLWNVDSQSDTFGKRLLLLDEGEDKEYLSVMFSSNGKYLMSCSSSCVQVWDIDKKSDTYKQPVITIDNGFILCSAVLSPNGKLIAVGVRYGDIEVYSIEKYFINLVKNTYKNSELCDFDLSFNYL